MAKSNLAVSLKGDRELDRLLTGLNNRMRSRVLKAAIDKTIRPIAKQVKAITPRDTGTLRRAIGVKTKNFIKKGTAYGLIGARRGFDRPRKGRKFKGKQLMIRPTRYFHLVEKGSTRAKRGSTRPYRMLETVWNGSGRARVIAGIRAEIKRELDRLRAKGTIK